MDRKAQRKTQGAGRSASQGGILDLRRFWRSEDGVATVDWVIVCCGATGAGMLALNLGQNNLGDYSDNVRGELQNPHFQTDWVSTLDIPPSETWGDEGAITSTYDPNAGTGGTLGGYYDPDGTTTDRDGTTTTNDGSTTPTDDTTTTTGGTTTTTDGTTDGTTGSTGGSGGTASTCPSGSVSGTPVTTDGADFWSPNNYYVTAGGTTQVNACSIPGAVGYADAVPHYSFNLSGMSGYNRLEIEVWGDCDTTLIVLDANGNWHFDDDSNGDLQPEINITNMNDVTGQIHVWVGTYGSNDCLATLQMETW